MGGPLGGPRPDPGPGGRAKPKPKPKVLDKPVPFTAADVTSKVRKAAKDKKLEASTEQVRQATKAIKGGTAEAHPIIIRTGLETIGMSEKEAADVGKTFSRSLDKSAVRRKFASRPARMATPTAGQSFASVRKPTRRKPVRRPSRMSGSGR